LIVHIPANSAAGLFGPAFAHPFTESLVDALVRDLSFLVAIRQLRLVVERRRDHAAAISGVHLVEVLDGLVQVVLEWFF
jgi:hypothetical protein